MIDQDQLIGRLLRNRYALDAVLANGAAAVVYRGRDTVLSRPIAVKAVPLAAAAPYRVALERTAGFTHPAVVALYDILDIEGYLLLVQELVDGRALTAYLHSGLPGERTLNIGVQIARALDYAHAHGVVHGDLTPSAVIVDRRAVVRINNFGLPPDVPYFTGLVHALDGDAPTRAVDALAAPHAERAPGPGDAGKETAASWEATPEADVRAAALLLWQVLSEPRAGDAHDRVFRDDVPEGVRELIWRAALPTGAGAITTAEALALALDDALAAIAGQRPAIPELTPPALQAVRAAGSQAPPPWAEDEALVVGAGQGRGRAAEWQPGLDSTHQGITPTEMGAPRLRLPSRPAEPGAVGRAPHWPSGTPAVAAGGRSRTPARQGNQVNIPLVIAIGVALFVLFFLIGYVAQPIHLP